MELIPKIGLDKLTFGMFSKDVIAILGEPDKVITDEQDENHQILEWNKEKLRLTFFQEENDRFGNLQTKNANLSYNGHSIINKKVELVKNEIFGKLIDKWEIENYGFFETHFSEKYWLTLQVEYGVVSDFEFGVPFKNDDDFDWPNLINY